MKSEEAAWERRVRLVYMNKSILAANNLFTPSSDPLLLVGTIGSEYIGRLKISGVGWPSLEGINVNLQI